ncbi:MAG: quinate 5-dehydrogenase [Truepera sp.]|nr:quinate 5-dehydrogenase [Truepera sp.]
MKEPTLEVVSVSLGSVKRDTDQVVEVLGRKVHIRRIGTGGDIKKAEALIGEFDGHVDAIGLGGIDLYFAVRERRYYVRDALRLARASKSTPVVCGAGLKNTLERLSVKALAPSVGWQGRKVLMVSAVDRFGMAEELARQGADVFYGDVVFALGLPVPVRSLGGLVRLATVLAPIVVRVPFKWLYPTGDAQDSAPNERKFARYYDWAEVLAGDWHFIKRYAPASLAGKTVLTNTTTADDVEFLRQRGASALITTTPRFQGRSLGTNLLEATFVAMEGASGELSPERYQELIRDARLEPLRMEL